MSRHSIPPTPLGELLGSIAPLGPDQAAVIIDGIAQDSRLVRHGDLFCCISGANFDGHEFIADAVRAGARAVLVDRDVEVPDTAVVVARVPDVRASMGPVCAVAFGHPSERLTMVGVTGTNGKTSVTAMLATILAATGAKIETIGTLAGARTTPEALDLQAHLAGCVGRGVTHVVMEVSSHALAMHRVSGVVFDRAVFTNLGRDHLDFHGTEEAYFAAKARLFEPGRSLIGVVNVDDPRGRLLFDAAPIEMLPFSIDDVTDVNVGIDSVEFLWRRQRIMVPIGGSFTVMNALAAATTAASMGVDQVSIVEGLGVLPSIAGRFQTVANSTGIGVVVDYAHTPDGLTTVLESVRDLAVGRVIVVFGCGGDRDRGKRPLMGAVASKMSDVMIVTSDNPRSEDPDAIIDAIIEGVGPDDHALVIRRPDRGEAITSAISMAEHGDIVVIAGKGHETVQEIDGRVLAFSDVEHAREALKVKGGESS